MRASIVLVLALSSLIVAALPVGVSQEPLPNTLYFTATKVVSDSFTDCGDVPTYNLTMLAPTGATSKKAYSGRSFVALGCTFYFHHVATEPFQLSGDATIRFFISCDAATVNAGVSGVATSVRVILRKNAESLSGNVNWVGSSNACSAGTAYEVKVKAPTKDASFKAGDKLRIGIIPFWLTPGHADPAKNVHILVESTKHPSSIEAVGLPTLALPAPPAPQLPSVSLSSDATQASGAAGETADFALNAVNQGSADANVTLSASGDAAVAFEGGEVVSVPANATRVVNFTAQVPEGAQAGSTLNFTVIASVDGAEVGNLTFLIDVIEKVKEEAKDAAEPAASQTEGARLLQDEAAGIPGWTLPTILAAIAAGVWLTRRRPN